MKTFPKHLSPTMNKTIYQNKRQLCYLRRYIYESIISSTFSIPNNCGIDLQYVSCGEHMTKFQPSKEQLEIIREELKIHGFQTTLSYGDTMMFIHTNEMVPDKMVNCISFE